MLAHAGEELLIPALIVFAVLVVARIRRRAIRSYQEEDGSPGEGPPATAGPTECSYCGAVLEEKSERCPACGFRVTR